MELERTLIIASLEKKGFVKASVGNRDHDFYFLHRTGKKTQIFMKVSRGLEYSAYREPLLKRQAHTWRITFRNLVDFLKCPMSEQEFVDTLRRSNWTIQ